MSARLIAAAALVVGGCAVGPDFHRPAPPAVDRYLPEAVPELTDSAPVASGEPQRLVSGMDIPARWWSVFESAELDALIVEAFKANPNVQSAIAALRAARENTSAQQGAFYPSVQGALNSTRQKVAPELSSPLNSGESVFNLHTGQLNINYVFDVFGGNRRLVESLRAQADSQRFQLEAAYLTLSSNVVLAAIQEASLREQLAATREIIRIETEQVQLMRKQLDLGAIPEANVVAQQAALAQAEMAIPGLEKQLAQQRNSLAVLVGRYPGEGISERFELAKLKLPGELPLSLPSKLVEQRPDVRVAEALLHAASAQVGVAVSNMLPQITLSAAGGNTSTRFAHLFSPGTAFWNATAGLTQPIFEGFALLHRKRAAEAVLEQAAAQYRATVLGAFQNVADTLAAIEYDARGLRAAAVAESATAESLAIARRQLELGDISYLGLLTSELAYHQAVIARIQAQAGRYSDTTALFQALGGGWWNRER